MIKLLLGASPCTYWSIAKRDGREVVAAGQGWELFKNFLIAKEQFKPDFFLYENNQSMSSAIKEQISNELRTSPIPIDSALVSAQMRKRYYWLNGIAPIPEDRGIVLRDILENGAPYKNTWCSNRKGGISAVVAPNFHPKENFAPKTVTERLPGNILYFDKPTNGFHPTEKPVPLLEYLIKTYTHEGDTVLDNCMGSGSTGVACYNTNRNFIGIELNKDYYGIAEKRLNNG